MRTLWRGSGRGRAANEIWARKRGGGLNDAAASASRGKAAQRHAVVVSGAVDAADLG